MTIPRYTKYKDSGVRWMGEVPQHWQVEALARVTLAKCDGPFGSNLKTEHYVESGVRVIRLQNIRHDGFDGTDEVFVDERYFREELNGHDVQCGDVLIAGLGDDGNTVGRACLAPSGIEPAMVKADCFRFRLDTTKVLPEFVALQLSAGAAADAGEYATGSTRSRIPLSVMASRRIAVPPMDEQQRISVFVDREARKLDALAFEQRRLIELLKEKRQAIISSSVAGGLDRDAPLKSPGVESLGDVPAHWSVMPLKRLITRIEQGWSPQCSNEPAGAGEWGVLKVGCTNGDEFNPDEQKALPPGVDPRPQYEINPGDIVMSRGNTQELVGMAAYVRSVRPRLLLSDLLYRFRTRLELMEPEFLALSLRSRYLRHQIEVESVGSSASMKKIGQEAIRELRVCVPPLDEQRSILAHVSARTRAVDSLVAEAERAIGLLQEHRAALISAAVTGKMDVRGLADANAEAA